MQCEICKKEQTWLESIGSQFVCHKCIKKNKLMWMVLKTNAKSFPIILKKLNIKNFDDFSKINRKQVDDIVNLRKIGVSLKTTNIVEL